MLLNPKPSKLAKKKKSHIQRNLARYDDARHISTL